MPPNDIIGLMFAQLHACSRPDARRRRGHRPGASGAACVEGLVVRGRRGGCQGVAGQGPRQWGL
jgi:hypothetical protein